jgi:hypothetical protein
MIGSRELFMVGGIILITFGAVSLSGLVSELFCHRRACLRIERSRRKTARQSLHLSLMAHQFAVSITSSVHIFGG